jgi:hypothetical protein
VSEMAPEAPTDEVEINYEFENQVLTISAALDSAAISVTMDWSESDDPGAEVDTLLAALPNIIQYVNDHMKESS